MSIELSIKQVIEEQIQKVTRAYISRLESDNKLIKDKQKWTEEKLNEALAKLNSHNNIIADRELSGDKINGGTITNFASTGINDSATTKKLSIKDDRVVVENDLEIKGTVHCKTIYYYSAKADNIDVLNSVRIDNNEVLWKDRLGNSVTKSKLQEVGVLNELNVADTLHVVKNSIGINTNSPTGLLGIMKDGIEIMADVKGNQAYVGTVNSDDFTMGSSGEPTIFISGNNNVGIKIRKPKADLDIAGPFRFQGQTHQYNDAPPRAGSFAQGDITWNSQPVRGSVLGWVCVKAGAPGTWMPFASL